jgi:putative nucleotide binding protein
MSFTPGERLYIGREGRTKVLSVLGRLDYGNLSAPAKSEFPAVIENLVKTNEKRFVDYVNAAQPINPRIHSLELIPGIGKTYMMSILNEREKKPFENFGDLQKRVGLRDPTKLISKRIVDEISGNERMNIFVRR